LPTKTKPIVKDRKKVKLHVEAFLDIIHPKEIFNTGEIADSLMSENGGAPFSKFIINLFQKQDRHKVLFLTKSNNINNLLNVEKHSQAIMSFSLNADKVSKQWENGAPSVTNRIEAAKKIIEAGYETRIRIDPMVPIDNWEKHYTQLIDEIFSSFTPERITLGSLRGLQSTINGCTDKTWVKYLSEWSNWGRKIKFDLRYRMYLIIINYLKDNYNYKNVALCKESKEMWERLNMNYKKIKCNCVW